MPSKQQVRQKGILSSSPRCGLKADGAKPGSGATVRSEGVDHGYYDTLMLKEEDTMLLTEESPAVHAKYGHWTEEFGNNSSNHREMANFVFFLERAFKQDAFHNARRLSCLRITL